MCAIRSLPCLLAGLSFKKLSLVVFLFQVQILCLSSLKQVKERYRASEQRRGSNTRDDSICFPVFGQGHGQATNFPSTQSRQYHSHS